ncbi:MAG: ABC transporter substrate-binding protein, partial [Dehalococcoidia bacterium]|nr:ABC transporter substrate-binding protein [Dehalococcoidia bacterium]
MKKQALIILVVMGLVFISVFPFMAACTPAPTTSTPIILGCPLSIGHPDGVCAEQNIRLAVDEINAKGGVDIAGEKHPFQVEVMDTRDLEPGVPTSESLLVVEKLILDKQANFIIAGPIRSEAGLAAMDIVSMYKTVFVAAAGFYTPAMTPKIADNYEKYKYCFRTQGQSTNLVNESVAILESLRPTYGFDKVFIMVQDVAHARAAGDAIKPGLEKKGWNVVGYEMYPTGSTDFSVALLKAKDAGAQVLFLWFDMPEASILMKQCYDMQLPALVCGFIVMAQDSAAWTALEGKCAYVVHGYPKAGIAPSDAIPLAEKYIKLHKEKFGIEPGLTWVAPTCYQVVYILKDAIERAGSLDPDAMITA